MRKVYLDSCVFIDWMKGISKPGDGGLTDAETTAVEDLIGETLSRKAIIVTSAISRCEVFDQGESDEAAIRYRTLRGDRHFQEVNPDIRIFDKAALIRRLDPRVGNSNKNPALNKISTPDAIHLATAIHAKVEMLWTCDQGIHGLESRFWEGVKIERPSLAQAVIHEVAQIVAARAKSKK